MNAVPEIRKYNPIWAKLKIEHRVSITAPSYLHKRIIKAVKKEKWLDVGYKLQLDGKIAILSHAQSTSILTFYLVIKTNTLDRRTHKFITAADF